VKPGEVSSYKKRVFGVCLGTLATNGFIKTEGGGMAVAGEPGVECFRAAPGEPSAWEDNKCTKAKAGTGEYVKIKEPACALGEEEARSLRKSTSIFTFLGSDLSFESV
jgi:hypothetical protein